MSIVVISVHFISGELIFASAAEALLNGLGIKAKKIIDDDGNISIIASQTVIDSTSPPVDPVDAIDSLPPDPISAVDSFNIPPIEAEIPDKIKGQVIVKELSSTPVPFYIDDSLPCSVIKVNDLSLTDDCANFSFCNSSFKFPIEKEGSFRPILNINPKYDGSIRTVISIDGVEMDLIPVLFKVENSNDNMIIFGQDVANIIKQKLENTANVQISTK